MHLNASTTPRRQAALTLTELLICVAILAVLVILAAPLSGKLMLNAHRSRAIANLRNMGIALTSYVNDKNGRLIPGAINTSSSVPFWFNHLGPYMNTPEDATSAGAARLERPAWQQDPAKRFKEPLPQRYNKGCGVGFGWNHAYFGYVEYEKHRTDCGWGARMSEVDRPSHTIIIGTSTDNAAHPDALQHVVLHAGGQTVRYNGRGLFLMLDGHVEALTPEETKANDNYLFRKQKPQ